MSIVAVLVLLAVAWSALAVGQIPNPFRARTSQARLWRRAFPSASKRQIGEFLALFADAFSFRDTETLKFRPDDQLLGVYRALNPAKWIPESKEVERLARELRKRYDVALADIWDERMTLGALFAHVQQKKHGTGHHGIA
jgi:propanediol dehydratase small subunit